MPKYATPVSTTRWTDGINGHPPTLASQFSNGQELTHEKRCALNEDFAEDCNCYVSRIRIITTPIGEKLLTTENDPLSLQTALELERAVTKYWHSKADRYGIALALVSAAFAVTLGVLAAGML